MEESVARVAKSSAYLLAGYIGSNLIALGAFMAITRLITRHEMGLAAWVLLITALGRVVCDAGLSTTIIRFVSEARGRGTDYRPFVAASLAGKLILVLAFSSALALVAGLTGLLPKELALGNPLFYVTVFIVVTTAFFMLLISTLIGLENGRAVCATYLASTALGEWTAVLLVLWGWGVVGYAMGWLLSSFLGSLMAAGALVLALRSAPAPAPAHDASTDIWGSLRALLAFSWPILITDLARYLFARFDSFVIAATGTTEQLSVYSVAVKAYVVITMIPLNVALALFPYYGERYGREDLEAIRASTAVVSRFLSLFFTPVALGLAALSEPIILVFAGHKYLASAPVLAILSSFSALTALSPMLGYLLVTFGRTKAFMAANLGAIGCALALSPFLIAWAGPLLGIAIMKGLALLFLLAFYLALTRRLASIDGRALASGLAGSILMAAAVHAAYLWLRSAWLLPGHVLLGALIYAAWLRATRSLAYSDLLLLSHAFPGALRKLVLAIGKLVAPPRPSEGDQSP